jgi:Dna[CI] antecedent, DciA
VPDEPAPGHPEPGERDQDGPERARRAADALAAAKADARARGERAPARDFAAKRMAGGDPPAQARRPPGTGRTGGSGGSGGATGGGGASRGGRGRREDPQPLGAAIEGLLDDQGWRTSAAVGSVFGRWEQIVGEALGAHTRPGGFTDGELLVIADSTAWATQVRLLAATLVRRLNEDLGHGTVTRVVVRGPAPPRRMGPLRVRGTRDHNDDYG